MKKIYLNFMMAVIILSFCGCNITSDMIGTRFGVAYFNTPETTSEIIYTYYDETQEQEVERKIEDTSFCDKLIAVIDGKPAGEEFCKCAGDYQVAIDNKYLFYLHKDKIVVYTDLEKHTGFTVECSKEEMKELYDIIEAVN